MSSPTWAGNLGPTGTSLCRTCSERYFPLLVGLCARCTLVQATVDVPKEHRFTPEQVDDAPDPADLLADHAQLADTAASAPSGLVVCEIGTGDGAVLALVAGSGVRHLGSTQARDRPRGPGSAGSAPAWTGSTPTRPARSGIGTDRRT